MSLPAGVALRQQQADEAAAVRAVVASAFGDAVVGDLEAALARRAGSMAYVAVAPGGVLGQVRLTWGWLDAPERLVPVLVLSPLSVAPAWRRRGVGRALVARAIAAAGEAGAPLLFLEGDPAYYARCGFEPAGPLGFLRPSVRIPEPGFQVVRLPGHESWMTGALVYPDTFWEYDRVGLRDGGAEVARP
ncbi:MAG TPA: GNAT family N-acetyltransferase [Actinomycetes bacterium]|nr:GNAT family N-acetyltransferase [Actinomycetes bacterium]